MAFVDQVQDLTSLTVSDTDELSQFLKDGVLDVTNRWLAMKPQDIELFQRESSIIDSNSGLDLGGAKIISVIREAGADGSSDGSTAWEVCRKIPASMQSRVVDTESLNYASKYNPAYIIDDNGKVNVYPVASANNGYRVFFVNNVPTDETNEVALIHSHSDIKWFPNDKVYLVVMYAGMRSLQAKMVDTTITDLTVTVVPPDVPLLASTSISFSQAAPAYTKPTLTTRVSFEDFFNTTEDSNPFGDNDPGALTISVSAPTAPSLSTITFSSIDSAVDATLVAAATSTTLGGSTTPPAYTKPGFVAPTIGGTADELTDITALDSENTIDDFDGNSIEVDQWFATAAHLIEDEEDTELAAAQLQKIQTYITAYQAELGKQIQVYQTDIQNELNEFNKENVSYQSSVQEAMAEFQSANQIAISNAERSQNRQLQNSANDMKVLFDTNTQAIQKYQAEIQSYQQSVADEVQEYNTKLQRYTTELNTAFQAWGKTETDSLQQYTADIQQELNEFNKENAAYQAQLQVSIQNAQLENQDEQFKVQKYQAEYAGYTAEVNEQVQAYTQNLQADGIGYQWLQGQYAALKAEYDAAFMIAAPKQQAPAR